MKQSIIILLISLLSAPVFAIQVSGNQSGTWSPDNNPYEMVGDITVPVGTTLTVQPGVIVQAMGLYRITAQGNIIANGTEQDSIHFTSGQVDPNALWNGIRLENTTEPSQFTHCRIELADYGINSINSPACISNNHFKRNKRGIQAYGIGSPNPAIVPIVSNLIEYSQQNGVLIAQNSNCYVMSNEIRYNGTSTQYYGAIQLSNQSAGGSNSPAISFNHIHSNYKQGIIAWDIVNAGAINPEIHDNLIENNLTGLYLRHSSGYVHNNTIINNYIVGDMNSGAGVMVSGSTAQPYFEDNIVSGNYTGFYLTENANPILGDLSIYHAWAQGGNTIANNIDANGITHSIFCYNYTNSAITVKAENNFWDYNTAMEIAATIEDHNDNATLPAIDFDPWQNNPLPVLLTGTVSLANPPVPTATLELVSAQTGLVISQWTVNINEPFSVPVYHDSLVFVIARLTYNYTYYYGAFGGTDNPIATQIIADVQFSVGDIPIATPQPNWSTLRVGSPVTINNTEMYPVYRGWFVYFPAKIFWLYRDGDFLRIARYSVYATPGNYDHFDIPGNPIWRKVNNLQLPGEWQQFVDFHASISELIMGNATSYGEVTHYPDGINNTYIPTFIDASPNFYSDFLLYDVGQNAWVHNFSVGNAGVFREIEYNWLVEPDGTLFPLAEGNKWKIDYIDDVLGPSYFGYQVAENIRFFWAPHMGPDNAQSYYIYNNGTVLTTVPGSAYTHTIPLPQDGIQHTYTISAWNGTQFFPCDESLVYNPVSNHDDTLPLTGFALYPNPFNPALSALTVRFDAAKTTDAKAVVYNLKGQLVWSAETEKGATELTWNGRDKGGRICASGLYQLVLTDGKGKSVSRKVMLIR